MVGKTAAEVDWFGSRLAAGSDRAASNPSVSGALTCATRKRVRGGWGALGKPGAFPEAMPLSAAWISGGCGKKVAQTLVDGLVWRSTLLTRGLDGGRLDGVAVQVGKPCSCLYMSVNWDKGVPLRV